MAGPDGEVVDGEEEEEREEESWKEEKRTEKGSTFSVLGVCRPPDDRLSSTLSWIIVDYRGFTYTSSS
ncbi:uncharacterized protein N7496_010615 [Penicillium cataractarum]|uniref:Uncharacterized protein n=1 Tax=Penicillium cataractarum TaxID=2100454 RepID=A0A9W9V118_9EURO|nr:uncharacterized protein N7496_010615 [Penicillium cataractarum]KAJ5364902.1 hypothetical protein N7496_010615 [Penicillium cataractarum]